MPYNFIATEDFFVSQRNITTLVKFAKEQDKKGNQGNRNLFLKLSIVFLVTRFQVFIESVLKEFDYNLKQTHKLNRDIPLHYRLNSIKLESIQHQIHLSLENPSNYNQQKLLEINNLISVFHDWCSDTQPIHSDNRFETKFPLGATGLNELKKLFKQVDGHDVFEKARFDIEKLNEILSRRHAIIHEDKNQQITELTVEEYKIFMKKVAKYLDKYLNKYI
jgi:hypothetical protein